MPSVHKKKVATQNEGGKKKWILIALLILLLFGGTAGRASGEDPQVAKIRALREQIEIAPEDQRRDLFRQMREEFETMSPEARMPCSPTAPRSSRVANAGGWMSSLPSRLPSRSPRSTRKSTATRHAANGGKSGRRKAAVKPRRLSGRGSGGPGGPGGGRGGPGGGRGGWGGGRGGNLAQRQKSYLDRTSPMDRAQRDEYRRMRDARRAQRGLPPLISGRAADPFASAISIAAQMRLTPRRALATLPPPVAPRPPRLAGVALLDVDS